MVYLGLRGNKLVTAITTCCGMAFLLFGYDQGVMGGFVGYPENSFAEVFNNPDATLTGVIVSIYEIGCLVGSIIVLIAGERLGRRRVIIIGNLIVVIGATLQASAFTVAHLIVGRVVAGIGNGFNTATVPMWQSETTQPKHRGRTVCIEGFLIVVGCCIAYWVDYGLSFAAGSVQWRFPIMFQSFFAIIVVALALFLPESPRWLIRMGRDEKAQEVICCLHGQDATMDDPEPSHLYNSIKEAIFLETEERGHFSYAELFGGGKMQNFRRIVLCFLSLAYQQLSGINLISYYFPVLLMDMGMDRNLSLLLSGVGLIEYAFAALIPVFVIEKAGRRTLLITGAWGQSLCMVVLAICVHNGSKAANGVSVASLFLFDSFFAISWLCVAWLYPAEITPLRIRSKGTAVASIANWLFNFVVVMITPVALENIQYRTYVIFAVINISAVPVVFFFFPETTGLTLEEVDRIFETFSEHRITAGVLQNRKVKRNIEKFHHEVTDVPVFHKTDPEKYSTDKHVENTSLHSISS